MVMMIGRFHRLIQSKLLWVAFLFIVVVTFVFWGMFTPGAKDRAAQLSPGELNGKPVSYEAFRQARMNAYLSLVLTYGRRLNYNRVSDLLDDMAWKRMATLDEARKQGFTVPDDEVVDTIQGLSIFSVKNRFSKPLFKAYLANVLRPMGFSESAFEHFIREQILLSRMRYFVAQTILVSPEERQRALASISDLFTLEYAEITQDVLTNEVTVTEEQARDYYTEHTNDFEIPEKALVKYVRVPFSNYVDAVAVSPDEVRRYYDENPDEFTRTITNTPPQARDTAPASTNQQDEGLDVVDLADTGSVEAATVVLTQSFEQARSGILDKLRRNRAYIKASEKATDFMVSLTPDRTGKGLSFEEAAAKAGLTIREAGPFTQDEVLPGIDAGKAFASEAFERLPTPDDYFSDVIPGTNAVYVLALEERFPVKTPPFQDVREEVVRRAREEAGAKALFQQAQSIHDAIVADLKTGKSFEDSLAAHGLKMKKLEPFSLQSGAPDLDFAELLIRAVLTRNQGEVTDLIPSGERLLLAYVAERKPADPEVNKSLLPRVIQNLRKDRLRRLFPAFQDWLLKQEGFKPKAKPKQDDVQP